MHALRNRGPEEASVLVEGNIGLAHHQLVVNEPPEATPQCLEDPSGRYKITYDGEVLNCRELRAKLQAAGYTFQTGAAAEVILHLYRRDGQEFLKKLRGYFVIAIYDKHRGTLFIARDRHGEKPLLYYKDADKFLFSTDMASLLELGVPREVDHTSLYQYLQLGYVPAPSSMLKGVKKLLPGHFLYIKEARLHQKMWYRLPFEADKAATNPLTYKQQQAKLEKLLEQAVNARLLAGQPAGVLLDGSINSAVVAALASRYAPGLKTFSVAYPGWAYSSEGAKVQLLATRYKTDHQVLTLTTQGMYEGMAGILDSLSEPFAEPSALESYVLGKQASSQVKHVLTGHGADELFAGYAKHVAEYQVLAGDIRVEAARRFLFLWNLLPVSRNTFVANKVRQLQQFAEGAGMSPKDRYWLWTSLVSETSARAMLAPKWAAAATNRLYLARKQRLLSCLEEGRYSLNNVLCADWQLVVANGLLPKSDLVGKAFGVEMDSPFLDHKIVKFAFSLPASSKIDATTQKKILQDTFRNRLPKEFNAKPKKGLELPLLSLLQGEARHWAEAYLADDFVRAQQLFDAEHISHIRKAASGAAGNVATAQLWRLIVFQHWWKKWMNV
jgi:asparagine synthase (glutamine-hydrolysing)